MRECWECIGKVRADHHPVMRALASRSHGPNSVDSSLDGAQSSYDEKNSSRHNSVNGANTSGDRADWAQAGVAWGFGGGGAELAQGLGIRLIGIGGGGLWLETHPGWGW